MNKKHIILISMLLVFIFVFINVAKFNGGYKINIINDNDKTVINLELKYRVGTTIQNIHQIEAKKSWKYDIDTNSINGEDAVILMYKDKNDNIYEESVLGYLEKSYKGQSNVSINKIDEDGKLEIDVK